MAEREEDGMISRIIASLRKAGAEQDATGTFADGMFPLTSAEQYAFDKGNGLRGSYGRDTSVARKFEQAPAAFA
jgi:hypothetical protein